ncbi:hypothetical protein CHH28_05665 [Bacterioplanes sanyensis]|uniref:Structural protein MipA n=1 Tax=Bacterioplanes sanyensis TaxID=1249553 RepID=A0A222FHS6_9GAMM|nr:MipA/OmpV family protein [Bacterioplanes sanyensis]ASP38202.1 hypothetical protein CHH28_05665 [Bacterioplanes sanyensis]
MRIVYPPLLCGLLTVLAAPIATAETTASSSWQYEVGAGSLVRQAPWHQQHTQQLNVPLLSARKGGWQIGTGNGLVTHHWSLQQWRLSTAIGLRDESVNSDIWGDADDPRYRGFDGGDMEVTANLGLEWRALSLGLAHDISGHSHGSTVEATITQPLFAWPGHFTPKAQWQLGARWLSGPYSDSLYGIDTEQSTAQLPVYDSSAATNPVAGIEALWPFNRQWQMRFKYQAEWLSDSIYDSPLVDRRVQHNAVLTVVYLGNF